MNKLNYIQPGNRVSWKSAAGDLTGTIKKFFLARNGKSELIPWMVITDLERMGDECEIISGTATLCATEDFLKSMRLELLEAAVSD